MEIEDILPSTYRAISDYHYHFLPFILNGSIQRNAFIIYIRILKQYFVLGQEKFQCLLGALLIRD